jgi:hypothetical protein
MSSIRVFVNPHPAPDQYRLSQISTETLRDMIRLRCGAGIPPARLDLAGVPHLNDLTIELLRRGADPPAIPVIPARGREAWLLSFECPWCPPRRGKLRTHIHGGGPIDDPPEGGHRVSHCHAEGAPDGYDLIIAEAAAVTQR